jgi:hypothetical protein
VITQIIDRTSTTAITGDSPVTVLMPPSGPQGPPGGHVISISSANSLEPHRAVQIYNGVALYCDGGNIYDAGLAVGLTTCGCDFADRSIIQLLGTHIEDTWTWQPGPVYVGIAGQLTQSVAGLAFVQQIATAIAPDRIIIDPRPVVAATESGSNIVTLAAGTALGGHRAVIADGAGQALYADQSDTSHIGKVIGITTVAAMQGAPIEITQAGEVIEPSWNWSPGKIFCGVNGLLTQTVPTSGFIQVIGIALAATKMLVDLQTPLNLGD